MCGEETTSKRKEVYYETEECGSVLSERRTKLHYGTEKMRAQYETKKNCTFNIRCTYVCVLNCTVPDVSFGERKKNQVAPAYIELSHHCTVPALLFCDSQSEYGSISGPGVNK